MKITTPRSKNVSSVGEAQRSVGKKRDRLDRKTTKREISQKELEDVFKRIDAESGPRSTSFAKSDREDRRYKEDPEDVRQRILFNKEVSAQLPSYKTKKRK